jgi:hypothetical protein
VFQANVRRSGPTHDIAINIAAAENADVILLQEPSEIEVRQQGEHGPVEVVVGQDGSVNRDARIAMLNTISGIKEFFSREDVLGGVRKHTIHHILHGTNGFTHDELKGESDSGDSGSELPDSRLSFKGPQP